MCTVTRACGTALWLTEQGDVLVLSRRPPLPLSSSAETGHLRPGEQPTSPGWDEVLGPQAHMAQCRTQVAGALGWSQRVSCLCTTLAALPL